MEFEVRPPNRAYLVCATPRSGSTLLCELLRSTGVAGRPLEHFEVLRATGVPRQPREYFDGVLDFRVLDRLAGAGEMATADAPRSRSSSSMVISPPNEWP